MSYQDSSIGRSYGMAAEGRFWDRKVKKGLMTMQDGSIHVERGSRCVVVEAIGYNGKAVHRVELTGDDARRLRDYLTRLVGE